MSCHKNDSILCWCSLAYTVVKLVPKLWIVPTIHDPCAYRCCEVSASPLSRHQHQIMGACTSHPTLEMEFYVPGVSPQVVLSKIETAALSLRTYSVIEAVRVAFVASPT